METSQAFNGSIDKSIPMNHSTIYLTDPASNKLPPEAYTNGVEMIQQPENKHTVVVLVDDPEQQRQMMLEQEMEDNQKLAILRQQQQQQQQQTVVPNTYQNLTTVTVLNLEQCY